MEVTCDFAENKVLRDQECVPVKHLTTMEH